MIFDADLSHVRVIVKGIVAVLLQVLNLQAHHRLAHWRDKGSWERGELDLAIWFLSCK